jgi:hypothetical protein
MFSIRMYSTLFLTVVCLHQNGPEYVRKMQISLSLQNQQLGRGSRAHILITLLGDSRVHWSLRASQKSRLLVW